MGRSQCQVQVVLFGLGRRGEGKEGETEEEERKDEEEEGKRVKREKKRERGGRKGKDGWIGRREGEIEQERCEGMDKIQLEGQGSELREMGGEEEKKNMRRKNEVNMSRKRNK